MHCPALLLNAFSCLFIAAQEPITLQPVSGGDMRFKDIAGQSYSATYVSAFAYSNANVQVTLDTSAGYLAGAIHASGLKPNFAYQVKLSGLPSKDPNVAAEVADDATNERLGRLGRWWRSQPSPGNANDADFELHKNDPDYSYNGYLLIAFFVTDDQGGAHTEFRGNNSYHVLWRTDQRQPSSSDGPLLPVAIPATSGNSAYDVALALRNASLYGEYEPTRALPGKLELPPGHYRCEFQLTEESFHDFGTLAGTWAQALKARVEFDISASADGGDSSADKEIALLRAEGRVDSVRSSQDRFFALGSVELPANVALPGLEVRASVLGVTRTFVLDEKGQATSEGSRLLVRRVGQRARFLLTLRKVVLVLTSESAPASAAGTSNATLRLSFGAQYSQALQLTLDLGRYGGKLSWRR